MTYHNEISTTRRVLCTAALFILGATSASAATVVQYSKLTRTVHGQQITIFTKPVDDSGAFRITAGPNGNLWFSEPTTSDVVEFTTRGRATIFPTTTANANPQGITQGADGNIWFTEWNLSNVARITRRGVVTEFNVGISPLESVEARLGSDGNVWFGTDYNGIGKITRKGISHIYSIPDDSVQVTGLALGPDNNIWYTETNGPNVGKITPQGVVTEYPAGFVGENYRFGIAAGSDGRIWFCDPGQNRIGAINTDGTGLTYYTTGIKGQPAVITAGPDGNLYFGELAGVVGRITTAGVASEYTLPGKPGSNFKVLGIAVGPDNNIWFTNFSHAQVGRLALPQS